MSMLSADLAERQERLARLVEDGMAPLDEGLLVVQFPLLSGMLRAKLTRAGSALRPEGFNAVLYGLTDGDGDPVGVPVIETALSGAHNGWPNIIAAYDPETLVDIPWRPGTRAVMLNSYMPDGQPCAVDPRAMVAGQEARAAEHGLTPMVGFEYECVLYEVTPEMLESGDRSQWRAYGAGVGNYDLRRTRDLQALLTEFMERSSAIGAAVSDAHTEYGRGMIEFALAPTTALAAADGAARARDCLVELGLEHGLVATFMARSQPVGAESANGGHFHQSLWRGEENAFSAGTPGELSDLARQYAAGQLARLAEWHLVFRPTINSYRRMDRTAWSPEDVTWGYENRSCALRAITGPTPQHARFELRVPGADASPHLVTAAALASGLDGVEAAMELMTPCEGEPDPATVTLLTRTLGEAIAEFETSAAARANFGDFFVDIYTASRRAELEAFDEWLRREVTDFEFARYLRMI
jgi:glutamine synthetase